MKYTLIYKYTTTYHYPSTINSLGYLSDFAFLNSDEPDICWLTLSQVRNQRKKYNKFIEENGYLDMKLVDNSI